MWKNEWNNVKQNEKTINVTQWNQNEKLKGKNIYIYLQIQKI